MWTMFTKHASIISWAFSDWEKPISAKESPDFYIYLKKVQNKPISACNITWKFEIYWNKFLFFQTKSKKNHKKFDKKNYKILE